MKYENALKFYLDAAKFSHGPTLEIIRELCRRLGDPQNRLNFVHIAGTNGKGSCAAMLSSIFQAQGLTCGLFTSPNLVDFGERIQIGGVYITQDQVAALTPRVMQAAEGLPQPSFFELVTALAFLHFAEQKAEQKCDIVVLECGLGGLYDATNIIPPPRCSVVMPIALDHSAVLGGSLRAIAREKAGILKAGAPAVLAPQSPEAADVLQRRCAELGIQANMVDIKSIFLLSDSLDGQQFHYKDLRSVHLPLLGPHQLQNAAAAIECARLVGIEDEIIRRGLAQSAWPCRFELIKKEPPFILDAAHNPHGALALAEGLCHSFPGEKFCFILGVLQDKDWQELLPIVTPLAAEFLCITPDNPRALSAKELAAQITDVPARACECLEEARDLALASGLPCCAFGSLYYIGFLRRLLLVD